MMMMMMICSSKVFLVGIKANYVKINCVLQLKNIIACIVLELMIKSIIPCGIHMEQSMESIWNSPWNPYGTVHGIHMEQSMESIWNSSWNPYGTVHKIHYFIIVHGFHGPVHGFHMEQSIWIPQSFHTIPYHSIVKVLILVILVEFENQSIWSPWSPYGITQGL